MKKSIILFIAILFVFANASCRKDQEVFTPYENSISKMKQTLLELIPSSTTRSEFLFPNGISGDTILVTPEGVRIWLSDIDYVFVDKNGDAVRCSDPNMEVKVLVKEARTKSDLIGYSISTTSGGSLLESGGMVYIGVTCSGQEVFLKNGKFLRIQVPVASQDDLLQGMSIYYGTAENGSVSDWATLGQQVYGSDWGFDPNRIYGYDLLSTQLGWVGSSRNVNAPVSKFCAALSPEYNDQNTLAYIVFPDMLSIAPMKGNFQGKEFCFENAPLGFPVKVVTVSNFSQQWYLGQKDTEIGPDSKIEASPVETGDAELIDYLKSF